MNKTHKAFTFLIALLVLSGTVLPMAVVQVSTTFATGPQDSSRALAATDLVVENTSINYNQLYNDDDFVFIRPDGNPINPSAITLAFRRIIHKARLGHIRVHDLRHTHATLMLKAGVHPKIVSERLGHASVGITLDTYSHVLPGLQEAAALKFDKILELDTNENSGADVSKMLANGDEVESRPYRSRTCDTLIKSQSV